MYLIWIAIPCMHISDLTMNLGYPSLVKRYWGFKSYPQFVPLKNIWGKLIHAHVLGGFDVSKSLLIRLLLVPIWLPRLVLSGHCWEICMLETRDLKTKIGVIFCNLCNHINGKCVDMIVSAANFAMSNRNSKCPQISSYVLIECGTIIPNNQHAISSQKIAY